MLRFKLADNIHHGKFLFSSADLAPFQRMNVFLVQSAAVLQQSVVKATKYYFHYVCELQTTHQSSEAKEEEKYR